MRDGHRYEFGRLRFGRSQALTRLSLTERRFLLTLGRQNYRLLLTLGLQDRRLAEALGIQNIRALLAFGLHLARHRVDEVTRRLDVFQFDAGDLEAPRMRGLIDHPEQLRVDLVALGERLVEVERAEHGTDIGHDQVDDRDFELRDLIGRLRRVKYLVEHDTIDLDDCVVLGDHVLRGHVEHLFHHVDLAPDVLHDRNQEMEPGFQRMRVLSPALDRPLVALRHDAHELVENDHYHRKNDDRQDAQTHDAHSLMMTMAQV